MTGTLHHKGFKASVDVDVDDGLLVGRLLGTTDVVSFHATDMAALKSAFVEAVEDYVATCEKVGKDPKRAASGNLMIRVDPEVHRDAIEAAQSQGKSLSQWSEEVIKLAIRRNSADGTLAPARVGARRKKVLASNN
ncbi:MAG: type II toxin-antitoxin system HicB family antitoxin [Hyphomicrobiaceae bacterium]|nr:type II toxin-antitoxin system HicB family antitoxin [Hyphomicrobiaceae bacterium]